jgi:hypothetical protein
MEWQLAARRRRCCLLQPREPAAQRPAAAQKQAAPRQAGAPARAEVALGGVVRVAAAAAGARVRAAQGVGSAAVQGRAARQSVWLVPGVGGAAVVGRATRQAAQLALQLGQLGQLVRQPGHQQGAALQLCPVGWFAAGVRWQQAAGSAAAAAALLEAQLGARRPRPRASLPAPQPVQLPLQPGQPAAVGLARWLGQGSPSAGAGPRPAARRLPGCTARQPAARGWAWRNRPSRFRFASGRAGSCLAAVQSSPKQSAEVAPRTAEHLRICSAAAGRRIGVSATTPSGVLSL